MNKSLFRVVFDVFGVYTSGKLAGQTNPKASARMTFFGEDFKECKAKLLSECGGIAHRPVEVTNLTGAA